eukprot:364988-Chlamydomonas_euryale.AAC.16
MTRVHMRSLMCCTHMIASTTAPSPDRWPWKLGSAKIAVMRRHADGIQCLKLTVFRVRNSTSAPCAPPSHLHALHEHRLAIPSPPTHIRAHPRSHMQADCV